MSSRPCTPLKASSLFYSWFSFSIVASSDSCFLCLGSREQGNLSNCQALARNASQPIRGRCQSSDTDLDPTGTYGQSGSAEVGCTGLELCRSQCSAPGHHRFFIAFHRASPVGLRSGSVSPDLPRAGLSWSGIRRHCRFEFLQYPR